MREPRIWFETPENIKRDIHFAQRDIETSISFAKEESQSQKARIQFLDETAVKIFTQLRNLPEVIEEVHAKGDFLWIMKKRRIFSQVEEARAELKRALDHNKDKTTPERNRKEFLEISLEKVKER